MDGFPGVEHGLWAVVAGLAGSCGLPPLLAAPTRTPTLGVGEVRQGWAGGRLDAPVMHEFAPPRAKAYRGTPRPSRVSAAVAAPVGRACRTGS